MQSSNVHPDSVIVITDVRESFIILQISEPTKSKGKVYKISYSHDQNTVGKIVNIVKSYVHRKLHLTYSNIQQAAQTLTGLSFNEIIIQNHQFLKCFHLLLLFSAQKFRINSRSLASDDLELYRCLKMNKENGEKSLLEMEFYAQQVRLQILIEFFAQWVEANQMENSLKPQKVELYESGNHQNVRLISLENKLQYGISVYVHRPCSGENLCMKILKILKNCCKIFSCQFLKWEPSEFEQIEFVFKEFNSAKYLIKFGNNLEITEHRLSINTKGMKIEQVSRIFDLMKETKHYELICHSEQRFFSKVVGFFMVKPLILFNFFAPLHQVSKLKTAIELMAGQASTLRKRVQVFRMMLKSKSKQLRLETVLKLYLETCQKQLAY